MNYRRGGEEIVGCLVVIAIVVVVGTIVYGVIHEAKAHPHHFEQVNAATITPGSVVYKGNDAGIVLAVMKGSAESPAQIRVRFRANDANGRPVFSEANFLPDELTVRVEDSPSE